MNLEYLKNRRREANKSTSIIADGARVGKRDASEMTLENRKRMTNNVKKSDRKLIRIDEQSARRKAWEA
jgi:hypothetical protein